MIYGNELCKEYGVKVKINKILKLLIIKDAHATDVEEGKKIVLLFLK